MRWLSHRGGALDFQEWLAARPGERFPVSVALGADPATILGAVTPVPDTLSEYAFAGLLRGTKTEVVKCLSNDLEVPASAEIILEGYIEPGEMAPEGPYGDHTGYYNEVDNFPVFTVTHITQREDAIYHSTYTGRPPDEPAVLGVSLNEVFVPILQKQFPEIVDFYLPPEGCSYRLAVVTMKKQYAGHAKRVMMGVWSFLRQFMYTKFVIVCDDDVNARDWNDVIWAITTRMDLRGIRCWLKIRRLTTWILPRRSPGWVQKWGWMPQTNGRAKPNASGVVLLLKILKLPRVLMRFGMSWLSLNN